MTTIEVPYIPQIVSGPTGENGKDVQRCLAWLRKGGFILEGENLYSVSPEEHDFSPSIGVVFRVLEPLESCGNPPRGKKHCPLLAPGIWMTVSQDESGMSHIESMFRQFWDEKTGKRTEEEASLTVGYNDFNPMGITIMAWERNIVLIERHPVRK